MMILKTCLFINQILMLELKSNKGTEYVTCWKSKGTYNFKLKPLHGVFLPNIKTFGSKIGM